MDKAVDKPVDGPPRFPLRLPFQRGYALRAGVQKTPKEDPVLGRLLSLFAAISGRRPDPECACCARGLFVGGHVCPPIVVAAREARALVVASMREVS